MLFSIYFFIFGLFIGSFLHTLAYRLYKEESHLKRSHCDHCKASISIISLIPILGFIIQKGKCSYCHKPISIFYPIFELFNGFLLFLLWNKYGLTTSLLFTFVLIECLLVIAILDFKTYEIFPQPVLFAFTTQFVFILFFKNELGRENWLGMLLGAGSFHFISYFYIVIRNREGLGSGDATLLGLIGFIWGWQALIPVIFFSSIFGLVGGIITLKLQKKSLQQKIAYGPWLILAAIVYEFFPSMYKILFDISFLELF